MPVNVRNFWITAKIDGRETKFEGGPKSKDGGFTLSIKMRDNGEITTPVMIEGYAVDGKLRLLVDTRKESPLLIETMRG